MKAVWASGHGSHVVSSKSFKGKSRPKASSLPAMNISS